MGVARRVAWSLVLVIAALNLSARAKFQGYAEQGGQRHNNSGIFSITRSGAVQTNPYTQQSYPNATVTVWSAGTTTPATIYSDVSGTSKANPFTASGTGFWFFYGDASSYDLRFSGGGIATPFTISGVTALGTSEGGINPVTFGAVCDGVANDTAAFTAAWNAALATTSTKALISIPAGQCVITAALPPLLNSVSVDIAGQGENVSTLVWNPAAGTNPALITYQPAPATQLVFGVRVSGLSIKSSNTRTKTAIRLIATQASHFDHLLVQLLHTGDTAVDIQGWDTSSISDSFLEATYPVYVHLITVGSATGQGVFDHWNFHNVFLFSYDDTQPLVSFETGASCTNFSVTGSAAWVGGSDGFKFVSANFFSDNSFENVRWENGNNQTATPVLHGYMFDIEASGGGLYTSFANCRGGSTGAQGFKFRTLDFTSMRDIAFDGVWASAFKQIDIDNTNNHLSLTNVHMGDQNNAVRSLGTALRLLHAPSQRETFNGTGSGVWYPTAYYEKASSVGIDYENTTSFGQPVWKTIVDIAPTASASLPSPGTMFIAGNACTRITIVATQADLGGGTQEWGYFVTTFFSAILTSGSTNVAASDTAGKLSLIYGGAASTMTLKNNTAITLRVKVIID